ncbi:MULTISPECIES: 6-phosphogluconolactonase [Leifsonia]|jgi:6-phosphogluconolactonase|uniref:6-phosphogluconolactonase n=3 Tax=Leifsonia TaxID=110932 RepID=U2TE38_LEIAQ|nr:MULTISPECIES: 6-phosphogluconolactonase [Leifsonia]ERK72942.1 6-phosphogluconolactonase [Leifsonia aquatica ATCC 14665]MBB2966562.1 6-phosphogluconolactonase [Leifsonia aquatica]NYK11673.1 6-phosphogluconolactonase [Leifsonia naganoensis]
MTNERRVLVHPDKEALTASVAARFLTKTIDILDDLDGANIALTGGTMGIAVLEAVNASPARDTIDWSKVHFWWGDERFVEKSSADRNERQAREALLDHIAVPPENIHPFPASDEIADLDEAARVYAAELEAFASEGLEFPRFDIMFLGVGPDGHIASLFPDRAGIRETEATVIAERESPKPPPERLSLTRPVINASDRIWLVLSGTDKASALGLALAGASYTEVPVAGAKGRKRTVFFVDKDAAVDVPENLIAPSY